MHADKNSERVGIVLNGMVILAALCLPAGLVIQLLFIAGCGDPTEENRQAAIQRQLAKENADLKAELQLRRLPESDQVEAFKQERIRSAQQIADMARQIDDLKAHGADPAQALATTLAEIRAQLAANQIKTEQAIQDLRGKLRPGIDSCHCGQ